MVSAKIFDMNYRSIRNPPNSRAQAVIIFIDTAFNHVYSQKKQCFNEKQDGKLD